MQARTPSADVPRGRGAGALVLAGGVAALTAKPAQALLFNGVDYQLIGPDLYQAKTALGTEIIRATDVPDAVRDALEILGPGGGTPGLVTEGAFSTTEALLLARSTTAPWYVDTTSVASVALIGGAGAVTAGAVALALTDDVGPTEPPEPPEPVADYFTGDPNIDALLHPIDDETSPMAHWLGSGRYNAPVSLTYSFATEAMPSTSAGGFQPFGALEQQRTRDVMDAIERVANITLTEVIDQGAGSYTADGQNRGHINLAYDSNGYPGDMLGMTEGWAIVPFGDAPKAAEDSGDVHLYPGAYRSMYFEDPLGGGATVLAHEIGHALGLAHPFEEPRMDPWLDIDIYTVMTETLTWSSGEGGQSPAGLMIYDIAALQHLYGPNTSTAVGDTVYTFNSETPVLETIWDAGGTDTIVHNGVTNAFIDLTPGTLSTVGGLPLTKWVTTIEEVTDGPFLINSVNIVSGASHLSVELSEDRTEFAVVSDAEFYWMGGVEIEVVFSDASSENFLLTDLIRDVPAGNVGIAFKVIIENATSGAGNDSLYGNDADNRLDPGAGRDTMVGGGGADVFVFASGYGQDDVLDFESGVDQVELQGFAPGDYTTNFTGYSTVLTFNTGDQLTLYTEAPLYTAYEGDFVYVA